MHEEEHKHLLTAKNIKRCMRTRRKNKKVDDQLCVSAVEGVKKWSSAKCAMGDIDGITCDDKILVADMKASPKKCQVAFTTKNLLKLLGEEVAMAHCDSARD